MLEASQTVPVEIVARYLELWLLKLEGVLPVLGSKLPQALARKTETFLQLHPRELGSVQLSAQESKRLESVCSELVEYHLEKKLKTKKMMEQLL